MITFVGLFDLPQTFLSDIYPQRENGINAKQLRAPPKRPYNSQCWLTNEHQDHRYVQKSTHIRLDLNHFLRLSMISFRNINDHQITKQADVVLLLIYVQSYWITDHLRNNGLVLECVEIFLPSSKTDNVEDRKT